MKRFVAYIGMIILLGAVSFGAQAQVIDLAARDAAMQPPLLKQGRLLKLSQNTWELDTIHQSDEALTQAFELTNCGDSSMLIARVDACCGCRVISYPEKAIAPKGSAELVILLNPGKMKMDFKRDIWVYAGLSDQQPVAHLSVRGYAKEAKALCELPNN
ncbi:MULTISPECIES: DUF1573 domain-containing protein [unclassified Carboxylicivirga]|uniref:DUF1573 domain-containing protein n=1 Tax=Carboxylicivirga TaxID=1628153 RepID=UPI003D345E77